MVEQHDKITGAAPKKEEDPPDAILTMQSFSIGRMDERVSFLETLNCPVIQVATSTEGFDEWMNNPRGLSPSNVAMSVALPETDGRIFSTVVGFKQEQGVDSDLQFRTKYLVPEKSRPKMSPGTSRGPLRTLIFLQEYWFSCRKR